MPNENESASLLSADHLSRQVPESAIAGSFLTSYNIGGGGGGGGGDDEDDGCGAGSTMLWSALDQHFVSSTKIAYLVKRLLELQSTYAREVDRVLPVHVDDGSDRGGAEARAHRF
jgi:hypothetical protein